MSHSWLRKVSVPTYFFKTSIGKWGAGSSFFVLFLLFSTLTFEIAHAAPSNLFLSEGAGSNLINAASVTISYRFTARASGPITEIGFNCGAVTSPPAYTISIQTDSGGSPSGVDVSGSVTNVTPVVGWNVIFGTGYSFSLTSGVTYHMVIRSTGAGASANASFTYTTPVNELYPIDSTSDPIANVLVYSGGSWSLQNENPIYFLTDGVTPQGSSYTSTTTADVFGANWVSESFVPGSAYSAVSLRVRTEKVG